MFGARRIQIDSETWRDEKKTLDVGGKMKLKDILQIFVFDDVDLCYVAQGRIEWWDLVSSVSNFRVL